MSEKLSEKLKQNYRSTTVGMSVPEYLDLIRKIELLEANSKNYDLLMKERNAIWNECDELRKKLEASGWAVTCTNGMNRQWAERLAENLSKGVTGDHRMVAVPLSSESGEAKDLDERMTKELIGIISEEVRKSCDPEKVHFQIESVELVDGLIDNKGTEMTWNIRCRVHVPPSDIKKGEIDSDGYNYRKYANEGHLAMRRKYSNPEE